MLHDALIQHSNNFALKNLLKYNPLFLQTIGQHTNPFQQIYVLIQNMNLVQKQYRIYKVLGTLIRSVLRKSTQKPGPYVTEVVAR